jgi:carnosine N-methyltransferase
MKVFDGQLESFENHRMTDGCVFDSRNSEFIDEMIADPVFADMLSDSNDNNPHGHDHSHDHDHSHSHSHSHTDDQSTTTPPPKASQAESDLAQDKVRSTLRSFVRDWSVEGAGERKACYDPCLEALEQHYPKSNGKRERNEIKVLTPGCGLGRLAMEIASKGQSCPPHLLTLFTYEYS